MHADDVAVWHVLRLFSQVQMCVYVAPYDTEQSCNYDMVLCGIHRMEKEIDMIIAQQKELEELLVPLEGEVNSRQLRHGQTTDSERERMYVSLCKEAHT